MTKKTDNHKQRNDQAEVVAVVSTHTHTHKQTQTQLLTPAHFINKTIFNLIYSNS